MSDAPDLGSLDAEWLDVTVLNEVLDAPSRWKWGRVHSIDAQRIGADFGFSGRIYRLQLRSELDDPTTIIAKFEDAAGIARAVAFREANEVLLRGQIPASYGERIDESSNRGLIVLEDVRPATQGDDIAGCTAVEARVMVHLVAKLHANSWRSGSDRSSGTPAEWSEREWSDARWHARLTAAVQRFPEGVDSRMGARLSSLHVEAADAHDRLQRGPRAWVHRDPHPDNTLWRPDGQVVLVDWSNATVAPPAIDVAVLLSSVAFRPEATLSADEVFAEYCDALAVHGRDVDRDEVEHDARAAVRLLIRGSIGWAGSAAGRKPPARMVALQAQAVTRSKAALRWLDEA